MAGILDRLKNTLLANVKSSANAAKSEILRQGGTIIASTPEGQAGIEQELLRRGKTIAADIPWGIVIVGGVALFFLLRRRR